MKKLFNEFKAFAFKGNMFDLAVGVVIGGAFGKIVTSLVNDIITPLIGTIFSGTDFTYLKIVLRGDNAIMIGNFIQTFIDFLIIAISIFAFISVINKFKKKEEPAPEPPKGPSAEELLTEIRDLLKENK